MQKRRKAGYRDDGIKKSTMGWYTDESVREGPGGVSTMGREALIPGRHRRGCSNKEMEMGQGGRHIVDDDGIYDHDHNHRDDTIQQQPGHPDRLTDTTKLLEMVGEEGREEERGSGELKSHC